MSSPLELKNAVLLIPDQLSFEGTKALTQFNVKSYHFNVKENGSRIDVNIVLRRIYYYHLTNTYTPTSSLLIIVEVTLYFEESQTETAIGLSLTVMLVMYTFYQSINQSLTKTAYLKMIDYWLLFCLLTPFVIFLIEMYWFLNKNKEGNHQSGKNSWFSVKLEKSQSRKFIQYLVPAITFFFVVCYIIFAVIIY